MKKITILAALVVTLNIYSQAWETVPTASHPIISQLKYISDSEIYAVTRLLYQPANIQKWDGVSWNNVGDFSSTYYTRFKFNSPTDIYAIKNENAPTFDNPGTNYNNISHWDGTSWTNLTNINRHDLIYNFEAFGPDDMYAVGEVRETETTGRKCVLKYDGTSVTPVGLNSSAYGTSSRNATLLVNGPNDIYSKYDAYNESIIRLKHWDGTAWNVFYNNQLDEIKGCGDFHVNALDDIYICASEINNSGKMAVGHWNGTYWEKLGDIYGDLGISPGNYGGIRFVYVSPNEIYIYGGLYLQSAPTYNKYQIAYWNGSNWNFLGNFNGNYYPNDMQVDDNFVYVTGDFTESGMYPIKKFARQIPSLNTNDVVNTDIIKVFPNPTTNVLYFSENIEKATLFSVEGKMILEIYETDFINISHLQDGCYFLKVQSDSHLKNSKTIKVFKN